VPPMNWKDAGPEDIFETFWLLPSRCVARRLTPSKWARGERFQRHLPAKKRRKALRTEGRPEVEG
jgi:hypothetical protein